ADVGDAGARRCRMHLQRSAVGLLYGNDELPGARAGAAEDLAEVANLRIAKTSMAGIKPGTTFSSFSRKRSAPLDLLHGIGLGAPRRVDFHRRALGLANERLGERRGDRDLAFLRIGLGLADDLPHLLLVGVLVDQRHCRAE